MILVAGSTGVLGFEICRRLRDRGKPVRALIRATSSAEKVSALKALGAEVAVGDLKDRASLDAACRGIDSVISTVTAILTAGPGDSIDATDGQGNINLVDAAKAAGVRRLVFVSFETEGVPESPLVRAKQSVDAHIRRSGIDYTILRPSLFMESWLGPMLFADPAAGTAKVYGDGDPKFRYVTVADVAEVAVRSLEVDAARNAEIIFGGPEPVSQREAVKVFEEVFGKPFAVTHVPDSALHEQWKAAPDPFSQSFSALMVGLSRGAAAGAELSRDHFPIRLTSVREFVKQLKERA
jgi:uncharacterized protein YbjT (DUF2867 family)